jgi:hypothetical protein
MVTRRQARSNIAKIKSGLDFRGEVSGVRQTYYVFEADTCYFVMSFALSETKPGSGYFNIVDKAAVDYVRQRFAGDKKVTAKDVFARAKRTRHVATRLIALNVLYVLAALGEAEIVAEGLHRQLLFSVAKT